MLSIIISYYLAWLLSMNPQIEQINIPIRHDQYCLVDLYDRQAPICEFEPTKQDKQFITRVMYLLGTETNYDYLSTNIWE